MEITHDEAIRIRSLLESEPVEDWRRGLREPVDVSKSCDLCSNSCMGSCVENCKITVGGIPEITYTDQHDDYSGSLYDYDC